MPLNLEDIDEVRSERKTERNPRSLVAVVAECEALMEASSPEQTPPFNVDHALWNEPLSESRQRPVRQLGRESRVIA